jgi:hypothetical protein
MVSGFVGCTFVRSHHEGGHIGPPLQKPNYLYERTMVLGVIEVVEKDLNKFAGDYFP